MTPYPQWKNCSIWYGNMTCLSFLLLSCSSVELENNFLNKHTGSKSPSMPVSISHLTCLLLDQSLVTLKSLKLFILKDYIVTKFTLLTLYSHDSDHSSFLHSSCCIKFSALLCLLPCLLPDDLHMFLKCFYYQTHYMFCHILSWCVEQ